MFFEFIATIFAGFAAAGIALLLGHLSRGRLPRWLMPVMAGGAMIAYTIWSEYSWFERTNAGLPEGLVVVSHNESRAFYRPWTYVFPLTDRFIALDVGATITSTSNPELKLTTLYQFQRWSPVKPAPVAFDCLTWARALLAEGAAPTPDGSVEGADWVAVSAEDSMQTMACNGA